MLRVCKCGFTLVELMIVVVVIGILAVTALPSLTKYRAKAKLGEATLALSAFVQAEQSYFIEYNTFLALKTAKWDSPLDSVKEYPFSVDTWNPSLQSQNLTSLGSPVAEGVMSPLIVRIDAGKADETGAEYAVGDTYSIGPSLYPMYGSISSAGMFASDTGSGICSWNTDSRRHMKWNVLGAGIIADIATAGGRYKDWFASRVTINLNLEGEEDGYCTTVARLVFYDEENLKFVSSSIMRLGNYE